MWSKYTPGLFLSAKVEDDREWEVVYKDGHVVCCMSRAEAEDVIRADWRSEYIRPRRK